MGKKFVSPLVSGEVQTGRAFRDASVQRKLSLQVAGQNFEGWNSIRVTRSIETIAGSFDLGLFETWKGGASSPAWPIAEGDECVVLLGSEPVITGYLDKYRPSYDARGHGTSVTGRDKTGDLVDCSAYLGLGALKPSWEFNYISLLDFATRVCKPFGIRVSLQPGLKLPPPWQKVVINPGDTAFAALEHMCRLFGVLPVSDGTGGIVLTRAGKLRCTTPLIEGQNIFGASAEFDTSQRYRRYIVVAQHRGTDEDWGETVATVSATAEDPNVHRSERVLLIRPEANANRAQAQARAQWEATTRAARSASVSVTVRGWTQADGELWPINSTVSVDSPRLRVKGEMLITSVTYSASVSAGVTATLELRRPDAFLPEPVVRTDHGWKEIRKGALTYNPTTVIPK